MFTILEKNIQNILEQVSLDSALDLILKIKKVIEMHYLITNCIDRIIYHRLGITET